MLKNSFSVLKFYIWIYLLLIASCSEATLHSVEGDMETLCGASVIAPKYAITAGHCVPGRHAINHLFVGVYDLSKVRPYNMIKVQKFISEGSGIGNDIALVKLKKKVNVEPICLPPVGNNFAGVQALLMGYGEKRGGHTSNVPLAGNVTVPTNHQCQQVLKKYGVRDVVSDKEICGGNYHGQAAMCDGDSGGPLMHYNKNKGVWMLIGVVSASFSCSDTKTYGIFTRVTSYVQWIQKNTNKSACKK